MTRAQLARAMVTIAITAAIGCNRAQTAEETHRAAADVKAVAARAGDRIADGWLTTRIQAQYFADDQVKARYVDVSARDGIVTIKGFVATPAARERALTIARNTSGVKQVSDQLLIGQSPRAFEASQRPVPTTGDATTAVNGGTVKAEDGRVTTAIQAKFFLDPAVKARHVDVETRAGVVTLRGEVASETERAQALLLARDTEGVQRVEDNLTVNVAVDRGP